MLMHCYLLTKTTIFCIKVNIPSDSFVSLLQEQLILHNSREIYEDRFPFFGVRRRKYVRPFELSSLSLSSNITV